jgi:hypothetical protein
VLHWPIRLIRIVTDPVVDTIFLIISYLILPSFVRILHGFLDVALWALSRVVPGDVLEKSVLFVKVTVSLSTLLLCGFVDCIAVGAYHESSLG